MEVSKLSYDGDAINGTGQEDGISQKVKMLKWLQDNPNKCKSTNMKVLSRQISDSIGGSQGTYLTYLMRAMSDGVLSRTGGKRKGNFRINYFHPSIPKELIDSASEDDKRFIAEVHERAEKAGGTVDKEGAIETKLPVKRQIKVTEPKIEQTLPVEVKQTKQGTQISFTININL